ncbi:LacI family DNA-binding transcriptional regulator [uncultured Bifidobacterium sp.]|uniref:LacI family DNA-binding transcriptional regulator n=1 Tax=uncultured Bifidobacterium sp. TaxID=165187 RepID=UPI0026321DC3|nr:LacI family DNA-binding transcriptional regulator [uncultured Bifidobacterium sp.]
MSRPGQPTILDVARMAGVSRATVSRYLNGHRWVSADSAAKIKEAIERTHYVANAHARALVTGRGGSVAFLLGEPQHLLFEDPNFATLLQSVADELGKRGQSFLLMTANGEEERRRDISFLKAGHVDGVIQVAWHRNSKDLIDELVEANIPTVIAERPADDTLPVGYVHVEDYGSARKACEYLHSRGAGKIAMIAGPDGPSGTRDRVHGFLDVEGEDARDRIVYGDYSSRSGEIGMKALLEQCSDIDAVFISSDAMAVGAMKVLRSNGIRVPEDMQIIGFDDSSAAMLADPPLTTIKQPFDEIGRYLVTLLNQIIDGGKSVGVTLPCELIKRGTTL